MKIISHAPSEKLNPFVIGILEITNDDADHGYCKLIPRAYPAFIFTAPESSTIENCMNGKHYDYQPGNIYFGGMGFGFVQLHVQMKTHFIVALLHPSCADIIFEAEAGRNTDALHCVSALAKDSILFYQKLWDLKKPPILMSAIEQFLRDRLQKQSACPYITHAIDRVNQTHGNISIKKLATESYTSERNLRRKFDQHIGLSPKEYANMIRFNSVVKEVFSQKNKSLDDISINHHYYDLSHLYKDFLRFTNDAPSNLLKQNQTVNRALLF